MSGDRVNGGNFIEHFRRAADGQIDDTQYQLVSREDAYYQSQYYQDQQSGYSNQGFFGGFGQWFSGRSYYPSQNWSSQNYRQPPPQQPPPQPAPPRGLFWGDNPPVRSDNPPQRDFYWGRGVN
jgi:hypothetical protein